MKLIGIKNFKCNGVKGFAGKEFSEDENEKIYSYLEQLLSDRSVFMLPETLACDDAPEASEVLEAPAPALPSKGKKKKS